MVKASPKDARSPKTRVRASVLRSALDDVMGVVESRNTIPILDFVLLRAEDERITLTATDLDCWAIRDCASDDRDGPDSREWMDSCRGFAVALPAKPLKAVLSGFDGDAMVTIEAPDEVNAKWAGRVTIRAGRARFKLNTLPVADMPLAAPIEDAGFSFTLPCSRLADTFAAVEHAISSEETRYYLNGIYVHPADRDLRFAATDGHRLARWSLDAPDGGASFPAVIVARKTVGILDKLLASAVKVADKDSSPPEVSVEASSSGSRLRFVMPASDGAEIELIAKAIDGQYPDYTRVIPHEPPHRAAIVRSDLAEAVKRVAVIASDKTMTIKASFAEDLLTLSVVSAEIGEGSEDVPCEYAGPAITFGFNSKYWRDALAALPSDKVAMRFDADTAAPVRISGWDDSGEIGSLLQVLMPVRV